MKERAITAAGLIAAVALALYLGNTAIMILITLVLMLAAYEIFHVRKGKIAGIMVPIYALLTFAAVLLPLEWAFSYLSLVLVVLFVLAMTFSWFTVNELSFSFLLLSLLIMTVFGIRSILVSGVLVLLYVLIATFATDTFAFFGGMKFGKNKLMPRVSPKKTVEGAISGYVAGVLLSFLFAYILLQGIFDLKFWMIASLILPLVSQLGDLSFSLIKRNYQIKDFGFIFPGHGGVLDRIDSLVFAIIAFNMVLTLFT